MTLIVLLAQCILDLQRVQMVIDRCFFFDVIAKVSKTRIHISVILRRWPTTRNIVEMYKLTPSNIRFFRDDYFQVFIKMRSVKRIVFENRDDPHSDFKM